MRVRANVSNPAAPGPTASGFSPTEVYFLTAGRTYDVAGVGVFEGELCVSIEYDNHRPDWPPASHFDMVDSTVPEHWIGRVFSQDDPEGGGWSFRLGYPALVNSLAHVNGVIEGDPAAMEAHYIEAGTITPPQT